MERNTLETAGWKLCVLKDLWTSGMKRSKKEVTQQLRYTTQDKVASKEEISKVTQTSRKLLKVKAMRKAYKSSLMEPWPWMQMVTRMIIEFSWEVFLLRCKSKPCVTCVNRLGALSLSTWSKTTLTPHWTKAMHFLSFSMSVLLIKQSSSWTAWMWVIKN